MKGPRQLTVDNSTKDGYSSQMFRMVGLGGCAADNVFPIFFPIVATQGIAATTQ